MASKELKLKSQSMTVEDLLTQIESVNKDAAQMESVEVDKAGYIDSQGLIPICLSILKEHGNLKLVGYTGTGKTTLAKIVSDELGAKYMDYQATADTQSFDLVSEVRIEGGNTLVVPKIVIRWLLNDGPAVLYVDEINMALAAIVAVFQALADDRRHLVVPDMNVTIKRKPDKYLIIAFNPAERSEYTGTSMLNIAFSRRFEGVIVGYLKVREEVRILKKLGLGHAEASKLAAMAAFTREAYIKGELITPLTLGNTKAYARLILNQGLELDDIKGLIKTLYPESQHGLINKFWGAE